MGEDEGEQRAVGAGDEARGWRATGGRIWADAYLGGNEVDLRLARDGRRPDMDM